MNDQRFRIGLDEAGYGPRLGPLVVGLVRVDGAGVGLREAWSLAGDDLPRLRDSKQVFHGNLAALETIALAAVACATGERPRRLTDFLRDLPEGLSSHPWYQNLDLMLPVSISAAEVDRAAITLWKSLKRSGVWLEAATTKALLEGTFNQRLDHRNKAEIELEIIEELLAENLPRAPKGLVFCDRLGGRKSYGPWLSAQFPFWQLDVEEEGSHSSAYVLRKGRHHVGFRFLVDGESHAAEIALASCLAKYARELMMKVFNRFWSDGRNSLRPTAGYPQDASRWLSALEGDALLEQHRGFLVRRR